MGGNLLLSSTWLSLNADVLIPGVAEVVIKEKQLWFACMARSYSGLKELRNAGTTALSEKQPPPELWVVPS